ncbi:MAG: acylneuraminate cytidylyltransferase family protein [Putridiphycobacter sp.]|nr:acylneuraminate cytidylyltransferase family protein [Putridiphycobacter sp.]
MTVVALIPARGGSKGLPKKNIKPLNGKPLINYSIESALQSNKVNTVVVSTDSSDIIAVAKAAGAYVPFVRPDHLSSDTATSKDVLVHAISYLAKHGQQYDYVVLLQPTSPFRKKDDIDNAIQLALTTDADMVVSVKETDSNPYYVLFEEDKHGFLVNSKKGNFTRRQDCPKVYELNGSIYVIKISALLANSDLKFEKTVKYVMDRQFSIDIDTQEDFDYAAYILANNYVKLD